MSNYDDIQKALSYIDPHDRDVWVNTGYSIKHELGENGFDLWDQWSQQADNYNNRAARNVWKSIKNPTRTIGSLFHDARNNGYRPDKAYTPPSAEEQARIKAEREAARLSEEQAQAERREKAKSLAQSIWSRATPADINHPYLAAKGITDPAAVAGLRQNLYQGDNNLLIPVVHNREIVNVQSINQDGGKRFLSGGQVHGGFAVVGDADKMEHGIVIAEGFATAASIHQATDKTVVVAFNTGNMVAVSERLAKSLPENVPVTLAVDNDASQTGMKKALQAAAYFGGRAQVVEPEFSMTQIRQYQQENGVDEQGRPKLPSDFNDLHRLAGIEAVREKIETSFRQHEVGQEPAQTSGLSEPAAEQPPEPLSEQEWATVIAEEAKMRGIPMPGQTQPAAHTVPPTEQAAETPAAFVQGEAAMNTRQEENRQTPGHETSDTAANSIEYTAIRPSKEQEPLRETAPDNTAVKTDKAESLSEGAVPLSGYAREKAPEPAQAEQTEDGPAHETVKKPVTDLNYRIPPESIESRYVVADGKYLSAANHTTVMFTDTGKKISTPKTDMQTINDMLEVAKAKGWDSIKLSGSKEFKAMMYVAAESQGIRTSGYRPSNEDLALLKRMREERSLNIIEPQTGRAPAVAPVTEKVAPVPYPGDKRSRPAEAPEAAVTAKGAGVAQAGERIVSVGQAPYRHNPENQDSPYIVLERNGKERTVWGVDIPDAMERSGAEVGDRIILHSLGKQPVEIDVNVRDESGQVIGTKKKEVERKLFKMEIVQEREVREKEAPDREEENVPGKPDVAAIAKADKMMSQNEIPSKATINTSHAADTRLGVPLQAIGQSEIPSEVAIEAGRMKSAALDTRYAAAKAGYMAKAEKLSKANKQHLEFHERNVMDAIRGLKGDARTLALVNYYEHTEKMMHGRKLDLPKPARAPAHTPGQHIPTQQRTEREHEQRQTPEPEIGR
ncbi:LPD7 domain-containing protein [Neisseria wadsworthii]|uniref:Uncharacterized protein n=1 Tax=Neisseria wadsworthii 9715 TaxID=1030841 RepID=G4CN19_9NEIS|nr:LPD7 domain-containing protein [Neisseria wadsworthii]EGZ50896.1 hypothetical protein HMPREF9370_0478 [Neisseria wadsworthii 9715]QMT36473.1 PriCT-2 domain-containing protein [Neisseria wadsworthii]